MKPDDFEQQLRARPIRPVPTEWRDEILAAAECAAGRFKKSQPEPITWWRQLFWPCPRAWAGLAAVWVFILVAQMNYSERPSQVATNSFVFTPEPTPILRVMDSRWAKMIDFAEFTPMEPPKEMVPRPRSDNKTNLALA